LAALIASTIVACSLALVSARELFGGPNPLFLGELSFDVKLYLTATISTVCWLVVTAFTPAEPMEKLKAFYALARPGGPGWSLIRNLSLAATPVEKGFLKKIAVDYALALTLIFGALFGLGELLFGSSAVAAIILSAAAGAGYWLIKHRDSTAISQVSST
jgi:hypothetical protein